MRKEKEFWQEFYRDMKNWEHYDETFTENDKVVLEAIQILFEKADHLQLFSKKACYLYLRELTSLDTKKIVPSLNKFKTFYQAFISDWNMGDI